MESVIASLPDRSGMDEEAEMPQWLKPLFMVVLLYGLKPVPFKD
jgi:hypothetical protein